MSDRDQHFIPLYAGPIHEAIRSGDVEKMRTLSQRARTEGGGDPEIQAAVAQLDAELARLGGKGDGGTMRVLYGGPIHEAIRSGDVEQMRALSQRARSEGSNDPEIQAAVAELEAELARLGGKGDGGTMRVLYGGPIHEAIRSGDVEQMRALSQRARTEGSNDPEIQSAVAELDAELARLGGAGGGGYKGGDIRPLYAGPIHEAQRSGDLQQMLDVQSRAQSEGTSDPEVQKALQGLKQEIQRLRGA